MLWRFIDVAKYGNIQSMGLLGPSAIPISRKERRQSDIGPICSSHIGGRRIRCMANALICWL